MWLPYERCLARKIDVVTVNDDSFTNWKNREEIAESMIPLIGKLHRERDVTVLLHSRSLVNKSVVSILKIHRFARQIAGEELSVTETLPFLDRKSVV